MQVFIPSTDDVAGMDSTHNWAAVLLAVEVIKADPTLFHGWNVSWTLRCCCAPFFPLLAL